MGLQKSYVIFIVGHTKCLHPLTRWVGGSKKAKKNAYVLFEWSPSYTVIMTYFFFNGKIHIVLNKLEKLNLDEYDSIGTALMVIRVLKETLGYTQTRLASTLRVLISTIFQIV